MVAFVIVGAVAGALGAYAALRNRIPLDETAAQELRAAEAPRRFLGFCSLRAFPASTASTRSSG